MAIDSIFANVSCSNEAASVDWYGRLFGRPPDARPMDRLNEWHFGPAGVQLYVARKHAGHSTLTIIVSDIASERKRVKAAGIKVGDIEEADYTTVLRLSDPDGNLVVLTQPGRD